MLYYEHKHTRQGRDLIIGVDEAGRGPLAGPVVAAAVFLKTFRFSSRIDDSKKLSPDQRRTAYFELIEKSVFGIGLVNERVIDRINILEATKLAMEQAVEGVLAQMRAYDAGRFQVLVDGNVRFRSVLPVEAVVGGDARSKSIASASIIAKVTRDRIMDVFDRAFPQYGFTAHKGYGTKAHLRAIKKHGACLIHRKSFSGV
jgi:ribonuclease HII